MILPGLNPQASICRIALFCVRGLFLIISVDRFFELFHKKEFNVSVPALIVVATAKYLMDFFNIAKSRIHILTLDKPLWEGTKKISA